MQNFPSSSCWYSSHRKHSSKGGFEMEKKLFILWLDFSFSLREAGMRIHIHWLYLNYKKKKCKRNVKNSNVFSITVVDFIKRKIECRMHLNNRGGFQSEQHTWYPIQIISCMNVWKCVVRFSFYLSVVFYLTVHIRAGNTRYRYKEHLSD